MSAKRKKAAANLMASSSYRAGFATPAVRGRMSAKGEEAAAEIARSHAGVAPPAIHAGRKFAEKGKGKSGEQHQRIQKPSTIQKRSSGMNIKGAAAERATSRARVDPPAIRAERKFVEKGKGDSGVRRQLTQKPSAIRERRPGMNVEGAVPCRAVTKRKSPEREERIPMKFDSTVMELHPEAEPHTRVTCFLQQYRAQVESYKGRHKPSVGAKVTATAAAAARSDTTVKDSGRVDLLAYNTAVSRAVSEKVELVNGSVSIEGEVLGVDVGDTFVYRAELALIGLHKQLVRGIDCTISKVQGRQGESVAVSVVSSGGYKDDKELRIHRHEIGNGHIFQYSGEKGGNHNEGSTEPVLPDQNLTNGNIALKNCQKLGLSVRLIRRYKSSGPISSSTSELSSPSGLIYRYDGMYTVKGSEKPGPKGKKVWTYTLERNGDQPSLPSTL